MRMTLTEAKAECERWFAYLQAQKDKSVALGRLASERRRGLVDEQEGRRRLNEIQGTGITVYDGGNLQDAVKALLKHIESMEGQSDD
jgi:hypothetical protein